MYSLSLEKIFSLKYLLYNLQRYEFDRCFSPGSERHNESLNWINRFILKTIHINSSTGPENQMQILSERFHTDDKTSLQHFMLLLFLFHLVTFNYLPVLSFPRCLCLPFSTVHQTMFIYNTPLCKQALGESNAEWLRSGSLRHQAQQSIKKPFVVRSHPTTGRPG